MLNKQILYIGNKTQANETLAAEFTGCGFEVIQAFDTDAAIDAICSEQLPDIVLLDQRFVAAPVDRVLGEVRDHFNAQQLPIIVLMGEENASEEIRLLDAGANDCVRLPITVPLLLARMRLWIQFKHSNAENIRRVEERVVTESLGAACHHLAQPVTVALTEMEITIEEHPEMSPELRESLGRVVSQIEASGRILNRLRHVSDYRTERYAGSESILHIESENDSAHSG